MKTIVKTAMLSCIALFLSLQVLAQDWSKPQKEIWQVVENNWAKWVSGDIDGLAPGIHDKYQGWSNTFPLPVNKEELLKIYRKVKETSKIGNFSISPARIAVTDNAATVDYYFSFEMTMLSGDKKTSPPFTGKYVEFYVKEGNRWMLLGDMTVYDDSMK